MISDLSLWAMAAWLALPVAVAVVFIAAVSITVDALLWAHDTITTAFRRWRRTSPWSPT